MDSFDGIVEFVAVAESQGFSSAAKQLGCSISHVSRQVARLEARLGCALLARSTRVVTLTDNGAAYYRQARDLVSGLQQANEEVNQEHVQLSGTLKVSAAGGFAEYFLAPALMEFAALNPNLTVDLDLNSRVINLLEDGIDLAVRYGELSDSNLVARKLVSRPMMAVASPVYLKERGTPTHPNHLKQHDCIVTNKSTWEFDIAGQKEMVKVQGRWRSNNANLVLEACKKGMGIAYMPKSTFAQALQDGELEPLLEPFWGQGTNSWLVYQNRRFVPMRVRAAIDFLVKHFADWEEA